MPKSVEATVSPLKNGFRRCYPELRMTKVQLRYQLDRPLDDILLERIAAAPSLFGLRRVQIEPDNRSISVEFDASRLTPAQVDATLRRAGIPASRKN